MSLTSLLRNRDVKDKFSHEFPKPKFSATKEILAPLGTSHYSLVGMAFDYLLRFYIERVNPAAIRHQWVAEAAHFILSTGLKHPTEVEDPRQQDAWNRAMNVAEQINEGHLDFTYVDLVRTTTDILKKARKEYADYISSGRMTDKLIESTVLLAQLDPIYRAGYIDKNIGLVDEKDIEDLRNLVSIIPVNDFKAKSICLLNPTFGEASHLVGGADIDLVIDDVMFEIKTTQKLELTRDYFNQLMGYYILYRIGGIDGMHPQHKITRLGIYHSRYAYNYIVEVQTIISEDKFPNFVEWFRKRAIEEHDKQI